MGYAVRIRRQNGAITKEEWLAFASAAPDFAPGQPSLRAGAEGVPAYRWREASFEWSDGQVVIDDLHDDWRKKIGEVADALGALAFGDDGERYLADGRVDYGEGPESVQGVRTLAAFRYEPPQRAEKKRNVALAAVVAGVLVLGVVIALFVAR